MIETLGVWIDWIMHIEQHLRQFSAEYGIWIYALLFAILFIETGVVVFPFLPGDSLLFAVGALAATGILDIVWLCALLITAAILGDSLNYAIGQWTGPKVFKQEKGLWFRKDYLVKTELFYEKYGAKAIVLARFVPIIRTFAPFVAGIGKMHYPRFLAYNILGGFLWVLSLTGAGYFLGNLPFVQRNFKLLILLIIVVSFLPIFGEYYSHKRAKRKRSKV